MQILFYVIKFFKRESFKNITNSYVTAIQYILGRWWENSRTNKENIT